MALKGKGLVINFSTNGQDFNQVSELNDATMSIAGENIDITTFGDDFINRIQGLKDNTFSLAGFYAPEDTDGQVAIREAMLSDTEGHIQFLADGQNGFQQEIKVSSFEVSTTVEDSVEVSIELEGTDEITAV